MKLSFESLFVILTAIVTNGNFTEEKPPYTIPPSTLATTTLAKGSDKHEGAVDRNLSNHDNKTGRHNPMQGKTPTPQPLCSQEHQL